MHLLDAQIRIVAVALVCWSLLHTAQAAGDDHLKRVHRYNVTVAESLQTLHIRGCFDGPTPKTIIASGIDTRRYSFSLTANANGSKRRIPVVFQKVDLGPLADNACIEYSIYLPAASAPHHWSSAYQIGDDMLTAPGLWLWRPEELDANTEIEVNFALPDGISVSTPWREGASPTSYTVGDTPQFWPSSVAFGRLEQAELNVEGGRIDVAILDGTPNVSATLVRAWLEDAATSVAQAFGRFPSERLQVIVVPKGAHDEPVPFAQTMRGGGNAIRFFIDQTRPLEDYLEDSTAAHEFSHMLHPLVEAQDIWLSEGIATYYEHVLPARLGRVAAQTTWQRLLRGFEEGRANHPGMNLVSAVSRMLSERTHKRVYWGGAAFALMADVALRERSAGAWSLDQGLKAVQACCGSPARIWPAPELLERLDALSPTPGVDLVALYHQVRNAPTLPDLEKLHSDLGVSLVNEAVVFDDQAPLHAIRTAITP